MQGTHHEQQRESFDEMHLHRFLLRIVLAAVVLMFHPRHRLFLVRLLALHSHDLVVHVRRQHANEGHHPLHEPAPASTQAVVFWLVHHFVHSHHRPFHEHVLRETWNLICIFWELLIVVLHAPHFSMLHGWHSRHFLALH